MTFRDLEIFDVRPHFNEVKAGQMDELRLESEGFGVATPWRESSVTRRTVRLPLALRGLDEIGALRRFWDRHRGRQIPFWLPAWLNDFDLTEDAEVGSSAVTVRGHGFSEKFALGLQYKFIALLTRDGKLELYGVTAVEDSSGNDLLTLDHALESDLDASETVCCPLLLVRPVEDELEYEYLAGDVIGGALDFIECPQEYPETAAESSGEDSAHFGERPVFLFRITDGVDTFTLADYGVDVVAAEITWQAADIAGEDLTSSLDMLGDELNLTLKTDNASHAVLGYLDRLNCKNFSVEVFLLDLDEVESLDLSAPEHVGRIEEVSFNGSAIVMQVSSLFRVGEQRIPKIQLQRLANQSVYEHATIGDFTTTGTITAIEDDPPYVEADEFGAKATAETDDNWFALGKVTVGNEVRVCTGQDGNRLYLNYPFANAAVSDSISAVAGDDKRAVTWDEKFDQLENFLGFPYIPSRNPQFKALETPKNTGGKKG